MINKILSLALLVCLFWSCSAPQNESENTTATQPNIVIIYLDDLGYGDLSSYGATQLSTPNIDQLANGGVRFTNGYATSATCTPSRYALLTGVYPWRNKDAKILPGTAPLLIDTAMMTLPKMLRAQGYETGIVGKWHLGLGSGDADWNGSISPGPNQVGFNYSYILAATQDRVPTVYIHNDRVDKLDLNDPIQVDYDKNFEGEPTGKDDPELTTMKWHHGHNNSIVNGIPRIGFMKGGKSALWNDTTMADHFLVKAQEYVKSNKDKPFFLYYALQQPHVPRTPNPKFVGKSGLGPRGDVILEADWMIGEFVKTLEAEGILENTLIVFSSDNGPVLNDGYYDDAVEKNGSHTSAGVLRGGKYSLLEAGTRVPFIAYWKGKIQPQISDALVCQVDFLSSFAALTGSSEKGQDSENILDAFLGKSQKGRENLIIEATGRTALRMGDYVMIPPHKGNAIIQSVNIDTGNLPEYQLYNLKTDLSQSKNLASSEPEKLKELILFYESAVGTNLPEAGEIELK